MKKHGNISQFWQELKRRKVVRVVIVYAMVAYVIIELANNTFPALGIPDWALGLVIMLIIICFPVALIVSWIFDVTPEGIKKTEPFKVVKEKETVE